jgi:hypothetical protein
VGGFRAFLLFSGSSSLKIFKAPRILLLASWVLPPSRPYGDPGSPVFSDLHGVQGEALGPSPLPFAVCGPRVLLCKHRSSHGPPCRGQDA